MENIADSGRAYARNILSHIISVISADLKSQKLTTTGNSKTLVPEDPVRAQKKYGHPFCYRNTAKLIFSTNKIPDSYDKSYAYLKRWLILSFDKVFHGITKDTNLINKLTTPEELSGMLNLALIALRQLKKRWRIQRYIC